MKCLMSAIDVVSAIRDGDAKPRHNRPRKDSRPPLRIRALTLAAILILSTPLAVGMLTGGHDWGDDFAAYIMQAASIVHGGEREEVQRAAFAIHESSRYF